MSLKFIYIDMVMHNYTLVHLNVRAVIEESEVFVKSLSFCLWRWLFLLATRFQLTIPKHRQFQFSLLQLGVGLKPSQRFTQLPTETPMARVNAN